MLSRLRPWLRFVANKERCCQWMQPTGQVVAAPTTPRFVRRAMSRRRLEMTEHTAVAPESLSEPTEE